MKHTISQAIVAVLEKEQNPMTIQDIYSKIVQFSLYEFKSKNPSNIIGTEIKRHCEGNIQAKKRKILFVKKTDNKYWLAGLGVPK